MANSTVSPQIPQHVAALLSHLTSRPGVQSTFILSRKDGSIIQSTGLLASSPSSSSSSSSKPTRNAPTSPAPPAPGTEDAIPDSASSPPPPPTDLPLPAAPSTSATPPKPHQPSQAEALAAQVFAFVSSASTLSFSLSHPLGEHPTPKRRDSSSVPDSAAPGGGTTPPPPLGREDGDGDGSEREDDDEVKLLRLRTKKHEIVVVPDRKYLLCVVHDATHPTAGNVVVGAGGGRLSR
ncbi:hypothetical protein P175DRAFT_0495284 [Aspergillus ochraceoroseus IBT 24754]|uniref:Roadblock/LAMTOR2 domain-containing protein n=2 Tax=Aspergillus ochraceoroseus TaxID=138278 RepID=A0A2T5LRP3_9EURO|nr:uncharacterized protein P175DRAFT_0495284 [Aspergillus ochraceoroseus IBT 24754]KKK13158.1 hypothetical protein AOCH_003580 [Aspergillus ochraceoroseus]PTU18945.1 hypothetical protein P175DRAFT_0495284 [Aspergillus ochraceoroseus IBT 24754]